MSYTYGWFNSPVMGIQSNNYNTSIPTDVYTTTEYYDAFGNPTKAVINDGSPRTISFLNNAEGQVIKRDVTYDSGVAAPHELHYYVNGVAIGDVTNDGSGTSTTDYVTSVAEQTATPGYGAFQGGSSTANPYADFDQSYDPINGFDTASASSSYTVSQGDTLQNIAQQLWGDASLWYLIADANGLSASSTLTAGMNLIIPNQVTNFHNTNSTYQVYNPNTAVGDTSPDKQAQPVAQPAATQPPSKSGGCGVIGEIILAVVAVAVTVVTAGAALAAFGVVGSVGAGITTVLAGGLLDTSAGLLGGLAIGAGAAAVGSIVSQGVGLATGIQSSFNWAGVAEAAIGSVVGAGISESGIFDDVGDAFGDATGLYDLGGNIGDALQGAASNAITQGIGVATGLQRDFNWTGVAAAGVGAGVGSYVGGQVSGWQPFGAGNGILNQGAQTFVSGMAGNIADAATRTLINGSDFGGNIISALPDTIGQTIGNLIAGGIQQASITDDGWSSEGTTGATVHTEPVEEDTLPDIPGTTQSPSGPLMLLASNGDVILTNQKYPGGFSDEQLDELVDDLKYRTEYGGLQTAADYAALTQAWLRNKLPEGFAIESDTWDQNAFFKAAAIRELSTDKLIFTSLPLVADNSSSREQAIDMGEAPGSAQGAKDMQNFVTSVLSTPGIIYSGVVNVGWSLAGAYAAVAAETEFANYSNLSAKNVQTFTFGSAPQTPVVAYFESLSPAASNGRSWGDVNGLLAKTTFNYNFKNDPVYVTDGSVANAAIAEHAGAALFGQSTPSNAEAAYEGYKLNGSSNLLFGSNTDLGEWKGPTISGRFPASHMIENYTVRVPGNTFPHYWFGGVPT